jgi:cytochrome c-type biogenesis protein CcmF
MGWGQVSVGPPYFGAMFILLMTPLVMLLPFGPMSRWKSDSVSQAFKPLLVPLIVAILGGVIIAGALDAFTLRAVTGWIGGLWLIFGALAFVARTMKSSSGFLRGHWGMVAAHLGVGVFVIGVAMVESATSERDFAFSPGQTVETAGLEFRLDEVVTVKGPNWAAEEARFTVLKDGIAVTTMAPQKRRYYRSGQVMTQVALKPGLFRDLYIAMGQPLDGDAWSIRVHVKPFIRWIWGGAVLMLIGGLLAATDPRYRRLAAHAADKAAREDHSKAQAAPA